MNENKSGSVSFEDTWQHESVALFTPENGKQLVQDAKNFIKNLESLDFDLGNLASDRAMFLFIRWLEPPEYAAEYEDEYYFGANGEDGDNSGVGHFVINLLTGEVARQYTP